MTLQEKLAQAAASFVGTPFRLYGRNPDTGLDCVGLLIASLEAVGVYSDRPTGYALRNSSIEAWLPYTKEWRLRDADADGEILAGDVLLISPGPRQHHIQIADSSSAVIHAHAGLRRVVREHISQEPSLEAHWRLEE
ncbi:MAG: NlpC/P60 family protein [Pseudomonadota bacterium]